MTNHPRDEDGKRYEYYRARWANDQERKHGNAVVEFFDFNERRVLCHVSPMALALRIAASMNLCLDYELYDQLIPMAEILTGRKDDAVR